MLSNLSLQWMDEQFAKLGFPFRIDFSRLPDTNKTDPLAPFEQDLAPIFIMEGLAYRELGEGDQVDASARRRWEEMANYRPMTLEVSLGGAQ